MPERYARAVVAGDACVDINVPISAIMRDESDNAKMQPTMNGGGTAANTAAALARLGIPTAFLGTVGSDYGGKYVLRDLERSGIDTSLTIVDGTRSTACVFSFLDPTGERHLWGFPREDQAYIELDLDRVDAEKIRTASWLHASGMTYLFDGSMRESLPRVFRAAWEAGVPTSFDLNTRASSIEELEPGFTKAVRDTLPYVKYLTGSGKDEFVCFFPAEDWKDSVRAAARGGRCAIARNGAEGYFAVSGEGEFSSRSYDVEVVNTTGAGDVFSAGFIAGMLDGLGFRDACELANAAAAFKVTGNSSRTSPDREQLAAFLKNARKR